MIRYDPTKPPDETLAVFDDLSDNDKVLFILDSMDKYLPEEVVPINSEEIVLHIGQLYSDLGRPEELPRRLERLASRPGLPPDKLFRYGAIYLQWVGDTTAAEALFRRVLKEDSSPEMKLEVAVAYRQMNRIDNAMSLLDEVSSKPLNTDQSKRLATTYLQ